MRVSLAVGSICGVLISPAWTEAGDAAAFRALLDRYETALRQQDVATVLALYEADGDFVSYAGQQASGTAELREFYTAAVGEGGLDHRSTVDRIRRLSKKAAVVDGTFEIYRSAGAPLRGQWTAVVTKAGRSFRFKAVRTWIPLRARQVR